MGKEIRYLVMTLDVDGETRENRPNGPSDQVGRPRKRQVPKSTGTEKILQEETTGMTHFLLFILSQNEKPYSMSTIRILHIPIYD